jgi:hypothetical protein
VSTVTNHGGYGLDHQPSPRGGLSWAQYKVVFNLFGSVPTRFLFGSGPVQKKKSFQKNLWFFPRIFSTEIRLIWICVLYRKDTNLVLKYLVFVKTLKIKKNIFLFSCIRQSLSKLKNHIVFSYNKENFKQYILACILALITSLLKSRELG